MKLQLIATEKYAYNSVPSLEIIKLITIIFAKMGQERRLYITRNFIKLFAFIKSD